MIITSRATTNEYRDNFDRIFRNQVADQAALAPRQPVILPAVDIVDVNEQKDK